MRRFANFYIVLFLLDAGLSLTDELGSVFAVPLPALAGLRTLLAFLVVALSLVFYLLPGIDRRLPKRVFLPLALYVFWSSMGLWPLLGMVPRENFGVLAAFGQVFVGGVALITLRSLYGRNLLPEAPFRQPLFAWRNTIVYAAVNLLLFPLLVAYSLMAGVGCYLDQKTAGFMRLSPVGVYTSERSYRHDGKEVRLAAMMHIARQEYYRDLTASLPAAGTIILAEGVTDRDRLLQNRFSYGRLAGLVGLSSQETMRLDGNPVDLQDLEAAADGVRDETKPDIVRADIDINRFHPETVEFLNVLGRTLLGNKSLAQGLAEYSSWVQAHATPQRLSAVMDDILQKRNAVVIDTLERSLERYDTVVVPWGAMHMPAIEAAVLERGFVPEGQRERLLFAFSAIPVARLWRQVSAAATREEDLPRQDERGVAD